jgi:6-pyruvoyltetrahydropterin/6-carboxytetrahydropterin synthase
VILITRKIEFDAGHRIPDHKSKCRNVHGHRYVLECTVAGDVQGADAGSDHGMIADFGDLKSVMMRVIGEPWDHSFLVYEEDDVMVNALQLLSGVSEHGHRTVYLSRVPTVENLVLIAAARIADELPEHVELVHVRLYETPNCWADWSNRS